MTGASDAELAAAARAGSDAAFARLVERHQGPLRGFLRRLAGPEADDLAQEAFLSAWTSLRALRDPAGFRPWLFGIAWRKARDRLRGARRASARDGAWLVVREGEAAPAPELRLALAAAMAELPPEARACVALCLAGGWSHPEAAAALGLPLGTVKSHVTRGRARLLQSLGGRDDA